MSSTNHDDNNNKTQEGKKGLSITLNSSSAIAPQASLPQASSTSAEEKPKLEEKKKKPAQIKLKFTLSTLDRKYDEGDDDEFFQDDEDEEKEEGEVVGEEEEEIHDEDEPKPLAELTLAGMKQEMNDEFTELKKEVNNENNTAKNEAIIDKQADTTIPADANSETASSIDSINPMVPKNNNDMKEEIDPDAEEQGSTEDAVMEDNTNEEASMESSLHPSNHKSNGFDGESLHGNKIKSEGSVDVEMTVAGEDEKMHETDSMQDKDSQKDAAANNDANNRATRTRSSYENVKDTSNDRESVSNEDTRAKTDTSVEDKAEAKSLNTYSTTSRSALQFERENIGFRDPPSSTTNMTSSFLDSLSEEQRRVRVRHLPNISGFRRLHKSEIKRDVASIKKMLKMAVAKGGWRNESTDEEPSNDNMDVDGNVAQVSGEETQSDDEENAANKQGKDEDIYNTFSLPYIQSPYICTDIDSQYANQNSEEEPALFSSPQVVESISAFNPPRPPESVGPKKMHRLHRWERNPQDVAIDLENYRKTVNRTRQELHKAEMERERIEVVGAHLRSHFMCLMNCMRREMDILNQRYDATQLQCVKAAELLTSKTRSRGTSRGSYVMKDVISVLKSRGEKLNLNTVGNLKAKARPWCVPGIGGVCTDENTTEIGCGWLLPGDKVSSPCGTGIVEEAYAPMTLDKSTGAASNDEPKLPQSQPQIQSTDDDAISSRVRVKLPFGIAYFDPRVLTLLESSCSLNDNKLGARWMAMLESAKKMGTVADSRSVDNYTSMKRISLQEKEEKMNDGDDDMTESSALPDTGNSDDGLDDVKVPSSISGDEKKKKCVSFGGGLLPLSKNIAPSVGLEQMEKNVKMLVKGSEGTIGSVRTFSNLDLSKCYCFSDGEVLIIFFHLSKAC